MGFQRGLFRQSRLNKSLTVRGLAKKLDLNPSTVSGWETGKFKPTADKMKVLSRILGVSVKELYGLDRRKNGKAKRKR